MRLARCLFVLLTAHLLWLPIVGQEPAGLKNNTLQVQRDANAVAAVQNALQSLGGELAISRIQNVAAQGTTGNSRMPGAPYLSTWQTPEKGSLPTNPAPFSPASLASGLLNQLRGGLSVRYIGSTVLRNQAVTAVAFSASKPAEAPNNVNLPTPLSQIWYFSQQTNLPVRVEYQFSDTSTAANYLQAVDYSNYQPVSGVLFPYHTVLHWSKRSDQTLDLQIVAPTFSAATP